MRAEQAAATCQAAGEDPVTCRFSLEELEALDSEGRCVMTDHGAFILINVYGVAITNADTADERRAFKLRFFEVRSRAGCGH
jgi:exonuclease III